MGFPILSVMIFIPFIAGIFILFGTRQKPELSKQHCISRVDYRAVDDICFVGFLFTGSSGISVHRISFLAAGSGYCLSFGVDGLGIAMLVLTGLVVFTGVMVSWNVEQPPA